DQNIDLPQLRDDLFRLVSLPCHCSPPGCQRHTSSRTTSMGVNHRRLQIPQFSAVLRLVGLMSAAMTKAVGTNSCASSSRFGANSTANVVAPVILPPGLFMLATRPICTGSAEVVNTMGGVVIAAFSASTPGVLATITATCRPTSSSAISGTRSYFPSAQRYSTATFWPSR